VSQQFFCLRCDEPVDGDEHETVMAATVLHMRGMQSDVGERYEQRLSRGLDQARPDQKVRVEAIGSDAFDPVLCWNCWKGVTFHE
jgi:hypothetical protein